MQPTNHYTINRAINRPIEFRGLRGPYILYAGGMIAGDLVLFVICYLCGFRNIIGLSMSIGLGAFGVARMYRMSQTYGEHGWAKKRAARKLPACLHLRTRKTFTQLRKNYASNI